MQSDRLKSDQSRNAALRRTLLLIGMNPYAGLEKYIQNPYYQHWRTRFAIVSPSPRYNFKTWEAREVFM